MEFEAVIGLEIHAELNTKSKMFCRCKNDPFVSLPNTNVCPVCIGLPGALPVANKQALESVVMAGLALNCKISEFSKWDRKNYYYPDLPKGYQISQYDLPITEKGIIDIGGREIKITRIHLEEDTGKLIHPKGSDYSLVDYNRSGVPLMELVTEPDIKTGEEARQFGQELQLLFRSLGISKADMEKGEMRVEVNISLREKGAQKFGTKVEVKNLNSFRAVEKSINYEIERQAEILNGGGKIVQETRGWNEDNALTFSQREKETAMDYRYFPEPDLPPIEIDSKWLEEIKLKMTELPSERRKRYCETYGLSAETAQVLVGQAKLGEYFEKLLKENKVNEKLAAKWLVQENVNLEIKSSDFINFIGLIDRGEVNGTIGKEVLNAMGETKASPEEIIKEKGFKKIDGDIELKEIARRVVSSNQKAVDDYRAGKEAAVGFLVGQVMKETRGQANVQMVQKTVKEILDGI